MADADANYGESVSVLFASNGVGVSHTRDGDAAIRMFAEGSYDLVLLDVALTGGIDGFYVAEKIRERNPEVPMIFASARQNLEDIQRGFLRCRADDYIAKPFAEEILLLKCTALVERAKGLLDAGRVLYSGGLMLIPSTREVWINHEEVKLTPKLFDLLRLLLERENRVISRQELMDLIWGYEFYGDTRVVDTHVTKLRRLLNKEAPRLQTIHRVGYKLAKPLEAQPA